MPVGIDENCVVYVVNNETERRLVGLLDVSANGVVYRNFTSAACL